MRVLVPDALKPPDHFGVHAVIRLYQHHELSAFSEAFQRFECVRCRRMLPENQFTPVFSTIKILYLHPLCLTCRKQARSIWAKDALYTPALHRFCSRLVSRLVSVARRRGLVMGIDADDVLELYVRQQGRCALSGKRLTWENRKQSRGQGRPRRTLMTIDRIDNVGNYLKDNIQLVCYAINTMKSDMPQDEFRLWCAAVVLNDSYEDDKALLDESAQ